MDTNTILIIVGVGLLLLIILAIVCIRVSNKKRFAKLQENIKKYKEENENFGKDEKIILAKDEEKSVNQQNNVQVETIVEEPKEEPIIEEYTSDLIEKEKQRQMEFEKKLNSSKYMKKDEFEEFLDEHAYSRRIINKDLMNKLKSLPPEVKAVLLSNLFNRYDL